MLRRTHAQLPQPVSKAFLLKMVDLVPEVYQRASPRAAEYLLRRCLAWAGSLPQEAWTALLDRLRLAWPAPIQPELQRMFLRLLGVDTVRLFMARPGHSMGTHSAPLSMLPADAPASGESLPLFLRLPEELQERIFQWLIPEPSTAHYMQSAREHAPTLSLVCQSFRGRVDRRVVDARRRLRGHWTRADHMGASPLQAIAQFQQQCIDRLGWAQGRSPSTFSEDERLQHALVKQDLKQQLRQLACVIGLLPKAPQAREAMRALFNALKSLKWLWVKGEWPDVARVLGLSLCLAHEGRESGDDFLGSLEALLQCVPAPQLDLLQWDLDAHLSACPPPACDHPLRTLSSAASFQTSKAQEYLADLDQLTDGQRMARLENWQLKQAAGYLTPLYLVTKTHGSNGVLASSPKWWAFAAKHVRSFLKFLDRIWPYDVPLPTVVLWGRVPPDLLRWAFQTSAAHVREALLHRTLSFDQDGTCLQLTLLCDFCLDANIAERKRLNCLRLWQERYPGLAEQLQAVAIHWTVLSGPPLVAWSAHQADGSEQFVVELKAVQAGLDQAGQPTRQGQLKALLLRASGPQDFDAVLQLAKKWLDTPLHKHWLSCVLDRLPVVCQNEPRAAAQLFRTHVVEQLAFLTENEQLQLLTRLAEACKLFSPLPAMALWTELSVDWYRQDMSESVRAQAGNIHRGCLWDCAQQFEKGLIPVAEAADWLAAWRSRLPSDAPPGLLEEIQTYQESLRRQTAAQTPASRSED